MKVLQVGKYYAPFHGGIETVVQNLAEGLVNAGDDVTVFCAGSKPRGSVERLNGVRVRRTAYLGSLFSQPITPNLFWELKGFFDEADVVHLHSPNPMAELAILALLDREKPLFVTYHSDVIRQRMLAPLYSPLQKALLRRARKIVVPTENHVKYSPVLREFAGQCAVVPFGLDERRYRLSPAVVARSTQLRENLGPFVLFIGRLVSYKGIEYLLEAMRDVSANVVIVGRGPLEPSLRKCAESLGLASRVKFVNGVDTQDELNAYLNACELFVLPSVTKAEAFGMVLLEAMAFKKPLVSTRIDSGVRLVNREGVTGLQVEPRDAAALGAAIRDLLTDGAKRERMGNASFETFQSRYTAATMVSSYRQLYLEALAR